MPACRRNFLPRSCRRFRHLHSTASATVNELRRSLRNSLFDERFRTFSIFTLPVKHSQYPCYPFSVIDIHSHILPGVDDGARSLEEAVEMARIAAEDGIEYMVSTPHMFNGLSENPEPAEIVDRVAALNEAITS